MLYRPNIQILNLNSYNNTVFVGFNENKEPAYAFKRSTYSLGEGNAFKGEQSGSQKENCFKVENSKSQEKTELYCYESAIDLLAHASLSGDFAEKNRLSLGGVSEVALEKFISQNPSLTKITFCLDSDQTGIEATERLAQKYSEKGFEVGVIKPKLKDFGEDLQAFRREQKASETSATAEKNSQMVSENKFANKEESTTKKSSGLGQ